MKDSELVTRLRLLGASHGEAEKLARDIRDRLHPLAAVTAARLRQNLDVSPGLAGNTSTIASFASSGAKAGSYFGPVGTAVGAVIGAIGGALFKQGKKPERKAQADQWLAELRQIPPDFQGRLVSDADFISLFYALFLGSNWWQFLGTRLVNHPSAMTNYSNWLMAAIRKTVQAAYDSQPTTQANAVITAAPGGPVIRRADVSNGLAENIAMYRGGGMALRGLGAYLGDYPGAQVTVQIDTGAGLRPFTFVNPGLAVGANEFARQVLMPMTAVFFDNTGRTAPPAAVQASLQNADALRVLALAFDKVKADIAPDNRSTVLANAPIAVVPAALAANAGALAASYATAGTVPQLPTTRLTVPVVGVTPGLQQPQGIPGPILQPVDAVLSPAQDLTAGILRDLLARQGANFNSQPAQQIVADVAADGVEKTPAGPAAVPPYAWALGAGLLALLILKGGKRHG